MCTENFETHEQGKTGNKQGNSATFGSIMLSITQKMMKVSHRFWLSFVGVVKMYLHILPSAKTNKQTQEMFDVTEVKTILALLCSLSPKRWWMFPIGSRRRGLSFLIFAPFAILSSLFDKERNTYMTGIQLFTASKGCWMWYIVLTLDYRKKLAQFLWFFQLFHRAKSLLKQVQVFHPFIGCSQMGLPLWMSILGVQLFKGQL